jgi:hypothetical protein
LAGLASIIVLKAIELGDVSMVQALGGIQYLILLGFSACCGRITHREWGENVNTRDVLQKTFSVVLIVLGLFVLFNGV